MKEAELERVIIATILDVLMDEDFEVVELSGRMACEIADLLKPKILDLIKGVSNGSK